MGMLVASPDDDPYERGHLAGEIAARLAGHDRHFEKINGSIERFAVETHSLTLAVQRLGDQADAAAATVVVTAAALKAAEDARRAKSESSWSPLARTVSILGGLVALATLAGYLIVIRRG
jgi:hypothetical protein